MLVIAIDGPAGSGKSTVARVVAQRLGLDYLDTGAMYRAVTLAVFNGGVDPSDTQAVALVARRVRLRIEGDHVFVDGVDATTEVRSPAVTRAVSEVAANAEVRRELVARQRQWAHDRQGGVLEGRDIATAVFPDANLKIYLHASLKERARRRAWQITSSDYDKIANDIALRDHHDSFRKADPLTVAEDAFVVDSTGLDVYEVVETIESLLKAVTQRLEDVKPRIDRRLGL